MQISWPIFQMGYWPELETFSNSPGCDIPLLAGHFDEADDLKIDTHGAPVKDDVWELLRLAYDIHGVKPTLLERDFNFPPMEELLSEVNKIKAMQEVDYA